MAVYRRGGTYWMEFVHDGQRVRRSTGLANKKLAADVERDFRVALARGTLGLAPRPAVPTLREYAQGFIDRVSLEKRVHRPETLRYYAEKLARLLEFASLRDAPLDRINTALIEQYANWRMEQPVMAGRFHRKRKTATPKGATVNRHLAVLRRILRKACDQELIARVPRFEMFEESAPRDFVLSPADEARYLEAAPEPLRSVAVLCTDCALRLGECLALRAGAVRPFAVPELAAPHGVLTVTHSKRKSGLGHVPLTRRAAAIVQAQLALQPHEWLFESKPGVAYRGTSLDHLHRRVRTAVKLPAEFVIHSLRHTGITRFAAVNPDPWKVKAFARHASVVTSERYVHVAARAVGLGLQEMAAVAPDLVLPLDSGDAPAGSSGVAAPVETTCSGRE